MYLFSDETFSDENGKKICGEVRRASKTNFFSKSNGIWDGPNPVPTTVTNLFTFNNLTEASDELLAIDQISSSFLAAAVSK